MLARRRLVTYYRADSYTAKRRDYYLKDVYELTAMNKLTTEEIMVLYKGAGLTMREISDKAGVSTQRIQQILSGAGVRRPDSEAWRRRVANRALLASQRYARTDKRCRRIWGIPHSEWKAIRDQYGYSPFGYYNDQRFNAKKRGIAFRLTFVEWWSIWSESGRWAERGRCKYEMGRHGDAGAYEVGNVKIISHLENMKEMHARKRGVA